MSAKQLMKKFGSKLLGKQWKPAAVQLPSHEKTPVVPLLDKLGAIQLHENWRN